MYARISLERARRGLYGVCCTVDAFDPPYKCRCTCGMMAIVHAHVLKLYQLCSKLCLCCNRDICHDVQVKVLRRYIQARSCELRGKGVEGSHCKRLRCRHKENPSVIQPERQSNCATHIGWPLSQKTLRKNFCLDVNNSLINGARAPCVCTRASAIK